MPKRSFDEILNDPRTTKLFKINIKSAEDFEFISEIKGAPEPTEWKVWNGNAPIEYYCIGDYVTYNGNTYECIRKNIALDSTWNPETTPSVWKSTTTTTDVTPTTETPSTTTTKLFAPFFDFCSDQTPLLPTKLGLSGANGVFLGFINGDGWRNNLAWGGYYKLDDQTRLDEIKQLLKSGIKVIVSSGGASGAELAQVLTDENDLLDAYVKIIETTGCDGLDFDIEGAAISMIDSMKRRNTVIARLKKIYPGKWFSYTLPVLPTGLLDNAEELLNDAFNARIELDAVNVMAMDYGDARDMGDAAINAAKNTYNQMKDIGFTKINIGITPMIGQNDTSLEIFTIDNANQLQEYIKATDYTNLLSFWSLNRDRCGSGALWQYANCGQTEDYQFSSIFRKVLT
jgi:hypothetical protein